MIVEPTVTWDFGRLPGQAREGPAVQSLITSDDCRCWSIPLRRGRSCSVNHCRMRLGHLLLARAKNKNNKKNRLGWLEGEVLRFFFSPSTNLVHSRRGTLLASEIQELCPTPHQMKWWRCCPADAFSATLKNIKVTWRICRSKNTHLWLSCSIWLKRQRLGASPSVRSHARRLSLAAQLEKRTHEKPYPSFQHAALYFCNGNHSNVFPHK